MTLIRTSLLVVILTLGASEAFACSCASFQDACGLPPAPIAFVGTVQKIQPARQNSREGPFEVTLAVKETLRGSVEKSVVLYTTLDSASCGLEFAVGEDWLIFGAGAGANISTSLCMRSQPVNFGSATIRQLRAIRDGMTVANVFGMVGQWDKKTGQFVQGAKEVTVVAKSDSAERRTVTASDGSYEFRNLPQGTYIVSLEPARPMIMQREESLERRLHTASGGQGACRAIDFEIVAPSPPIPPN